MTDIELFEKVEWIQRKSKEEGLEVQHKGNAFFIYAKDFSDGYPYTSLKTIDEVCTWIHGFCIKDLYLEGLEDYKNRNKKKEKQK